LAAAVSSARKHSHQQAGFTAGTVADDDELAADLSHGLKVTGLWRKKRGIECCDGNAALDANLLDGMRLALAEDGRREQVFLRRTDCVLRFGWEVTRKQEGEEGNRHHQETSLEEGAGLIKQFEVEPSGSGQHARWQAGSPYFSNGSRGLDPYSSHRCGLGALASRH
jgi:hypothetical protein